MEENRKAFESILTKDQKAELEKIKSEHEKKKDMPRRCPLKDGQVSDKK